MASLLAEYYQRDKTVLVLFGLEQTRALIGMTAIQTRFTDQTFLTIEQSLAIEFGLPILIKATHCGLEQIEVFVIMMKTVRPLLELKQALGQFI